MKLLIKNGTIVRTGRRADIWIRDKKIEKIAPDIRETADRTVDAEGLHIYTGFTDMHCHLREPGQTRKEDILSGTRAAAAGGFTQICCMPNTTPPVDTPDAVRYILSRERVVKVSPVACITRLQKGEELTDFAALHEAGAIAFSDDGLPVGDSGVMKKALKTARHTGVRLLLHEEDLSLRADGAANEGACARAAGIKGIPKSAEEVMTARDIILAEETGCPLHICHVSTSGSVRMIRDAKKRGVLVTCETAPHYFSLDDSAVSTGNPNMKVNPPLRSQEDVRAIRQGIADGTIDAIATDHAPHAEEDKAGGFMKAAFGLIGFETAYSLGMMYLVHAGLITEQRLELLMSVRPREILGLGGELEEGETADITICDPEQEYVYDLSSVVSRSKNSPFLGRKMVGRVCYTIVDGGIVYDRYADS